MSNFDAGWAKFIVEFGSAASAAAVASYVRLRTNPRPFSFPRIVAYTAEGIVCGFLAVGISAALTAMFSLDSHRVATGAGAALGLVGTSVLRDVIMRVMMRGIEKV